MLSVVYGVVLALIAAAPLLAGQTSAVATCRSVGLDPVRTWRFASSAGQWRVTHWRGAAEADAASVALPSGTKVRLEASEVLVKGRTSNGGIDVSLSGRPQQARLDIYVSYELEVNVDASLTPKIDDLNTEGALGVRCDVTHAP